MKEENKKEIPLSILIENAKKEYLNKINEVTEKYNMPPYFVWTIFSGFLMEMEKNKDSQIFAEMQYMENEKNKNKEELK